MVHSSLVLLLVGVAALSAATFVPVKSVNSKALQLPAFLAREAARKALTPKKYHAPKTENMQKIPAVFALAQETGESGVLDNLFCKTCEDLFDGIESFAQDVVDDYLHEYVPQMCEGLPFQNLVDDCENYIYREVDDLFEVLRTAEGPEKICQQIQLC